MRILTETDIAAPADHVWDIITDFASYPEWNPLLVRMKGEPIVGKRLRFRIGIGPVRIPADAEVVVAERGRELRWVGMARRSLRPIVSGEHYFVIEPLDAGRCHLTHGEDFRGWLAPRSARIEAALTKRYETLTQAIRERAERS
jgi:hypothetical protein